MPVVIHFSSLTFNLHVSFWVILVPWSVGPLWSIPSNISHHFQWQFGPTDQNLVQRTTRNAPNKYDPALPEQPVSSLNNQFQMIKFHQNHQKILNLLDLLLKLF